ncbi:hypothetical protein KIN20_033097 [Parelaphostrongylus tenuis]|uniref:RING-type domain-containing protein n=1 Tax=Parelaphostrongylus tenuis TaxID=148309 RepID=A0AAD5WHZ2_PARTN|nr:hypothetical protein KIN20_033097 [Parelaphostrongylus tenuis]
MAPVATRRSQLRKKKAASIKQRNAKDYLSTQISRESKQIAKATCFFDESLLACDICLEVMHNAMNVSPCNHKFCAGCIYEWNSLNTKCPKCRWSAADITRDTTLNSIIEQYLIAFPEKRRDAAQLIELDERELNHLEKWQRKGEIHEEGVSYGLGQHYLEVLESEDSDIFEPQDDQLEEDAEVESVLERTSSERDEYLSRRNLEIARMERLRREKEERERLKEIEERSRRSNVNNKKEKRRGLRCNNVTSGRNNNSRRSSSQRNLPTATPSTRTVVTRSMSRRL